jgi:cyclophilin family peptidyl-prolyl cis-trans isomerase
MSKVKISTDKGDMIAELYDNETPITVNNFLKLIGEKFYDGLNFHRVIPGFVAQGGCQIKEETVDQVILSNVKYPPQNNSTTQESFQWHTQEETQVVLSSSSVTTDKERNT